VGVFVPFGQFRRKGRRLARSLGEHLAQKRPAPAATGAGAKALAQLAGPLRLFDADEAQQLPLRDVKTETDFVVRLHQQDSAGFGFS